MAVEKIQIEKFLELARHYPVLDVRSPGEYAHAHIPGAYNLPLFSDEERKIVGTTYKQQSREQAIKIGLDFFGPKMKLLIEMAEEIIRNRKPAISNPANNGNLLPIANCLLLYCWRGGMRSAGVAWLLDLYGFKVYTLAGGYKKFRNYVLDTFKLPFQFNILGGYTGSGKTELLKKLKERGEAVIDLEDIAKHKGSAFGNIGLPPQPGLEMFENLLCFELQEAIGKESWISKNSDYELKAPSIWLEDESQRIGRVNIPNDLWETMRKSNVYFIDIPFEERLKHIVQEYGSLDTEQVISAIERISQKLGNLNAKMAILLLKEGKIVESFDILLKYYDKLYFKSLHNRKALNSLLNTIKFESVTPENTDFIVLQTKYQFEKP